jgi:nucleoside-diphosphate-sugar epimerase
VAATGLAAEAPDLHARVFNVGGGSHITVRAALGLIERFVGRRLQVRYVTREAGDVTETLADVTRSREVLGFQAGVSFEDGLLAEFDWVVDGVESTRATAGRRPPSG